MIGVDSVISRAIIYIDVNNYFKIVEFTLRTK